MRTRRKPAPPPPDAIIAIDPGERAGIAVFVRGRLREVRAVNGNDGYEVARAMEWARTLPNALDSDVMRVACVVESQFLRFPKGYRTLVVRAARWAQEWERRAPGRSVTWVEPSVWQAAVLGRRRGTGEALREATMRRARSECSSSGMTPDMASAVCIGLWASVGMGVVEGWVR